MLCLFPSFPPIYFTLRQRPPQGMGQGQGQMMPYRGPPGGQGEVAGQIGGFFSKMKNKIFEGAAAIAGTEHMHPPGDQQRRPTGPPGPYGQPSRGGPGAQGPPKPPGMQGAGSRGPPVPQGQMNRPSGNMGMGGSPGGHGPGEDGGSNIWGKLKGFFSDGDEEIQKSGERKPPGYGGSDRSPGSGYPGSTRPPGPPPGFGGRPSGPSASTSMGGMGSAQGGYPSHSYPPDSSPFASPPPPPSSSYPSEFNPFEEPVVHDLPSQYPDGSSHDSYSATPPPPPPPSDFDGMSSSPYDMPSDPYGTQSSTSMDQEQSQPSYPTDGLFDGYSDSPFGFTEQPAPVPEVSEPSYPPEPQIFVVEDCIVLIPRPAEFYKKKIEIANAGPSSLQVFTEYERCLTKFRTDGGERAMSTAELLESSSVLMPTALEKIKGVIDNFADMGCDGATYEAEENYTAEREKIIAQDGQLHMGNIAPATRDMIPRMPLRDGWKDVFHSLAYKGVPTFIFSDGYGDIVSQALSQGGGFDAGNLPQNVRIISNMFRTAPDGTVRAFSHPLVHSRNKNVTTASSVMGFPVPTRSYALLIGAHENDVNMLSGLEGMKDKVALGFLEMTTDLTERLPTFLDTYDAIVMGDGSFQYAKTLIEELLEPPEPMIGMDMQQNMYSEPPRSAHAMDSYMGMGMF